MADTIELMKQRVLQQAMRGKLVEHDLRDDSVLETGSSESIENIPYEIPKNWDWLELKDFVDNCSSQRRPVSAKERNEMAGPYPYYGASGIIDSVNGWTHDGRFILIGEDGANLLSRSTPLAFIAEGKIWVNNHAHVLKSKEMNDDEFLVHYINSISVEPYITGSAQPKLNQRNLNRIKVPRPPLSEQQRIVSKIEEIFSIIDKIAERKEDALQTIQLIRQTTLQQAIQGKLVEQNEQDEPAIKLLDEIEKEKPTLINKMGVRKPRKTSEVTEDEVLFNIPNSWIWTRLSELGLVIGGGTPKTSVEEYWEKGTISWITPADLSNYNEMYISEGNRKITDLGLEKSSAKLMPSGSVLYSSRAPIGYIAIASNPIATNQGFKSIVPYVMDTNKYIYYHLQAFTDEIESRSSGTTFKEISGTEFGKTLVPLPPLSEQKRIVEKIEHIMELCDQMEELFK